MDDGLQLQDIKLICLVQDTRYRKYRVPSKCDLPSGEYGALPLLRGGAIRYLLEGISLVNECY